MDTMYFNIMEFLRSAMHDPIPVANIHFFLHKTVEVGLGTLVLALCYGVQVPYWLHLYCIHSEL